MLPTVYHTKKFFNAFIIVTILSFSAVCPSRSTDTELYRSGLDPTELPQLHKILTELNLPHEINPNGDGFLVPAESLIQTRVALARRGLPLKLGRAWDVESEATGKIAYTRRYARLELARQEIEKALEFYPEIKLSIVDLSLDCHRHCYIDSDHICEMGRIAIIEGRGFPPFPKQQTQGLLKMLALVEPKLRRTVVTTYDGTEYETSELNLDFRWKQAGWPFKKPW